MKKIICILLIISLCITPALAASSVDNLSSDEILYVTSVGHGCYSTTTNTNTNGITRDVDSIRLKPYAEDIYQMAGTKNENLLLRVNEDTFLKVSEVNINVENLEEVEKVIAEYELSDNFANKLRNINEKLEAGEITTCTVIMYTPDSPSVNTMSTQNTASLYATPTTNYYVGYNNRNYKDSVLYVNWNSNPTIATGALVDKWQTVANVVVDTFYLAADLLLPTKIGVGASIAQIIGSTLVVNNVVRDGSTKVETVVISSETKWEKQTAMQVYNDYVWGAISSKGSHHFNFCESIPGVGASEWKKGALFSYTRPKYNTLDAKAYEVVTGSGIVYDESMQTWKLNDYLSFASY